MSEFPALLYTLFYSVIYNSVVQVYYHNGKEYCTVYSFSFRYPYLSFLLRVPTLTEKIQKQSYVVLIVVDN